MAKVKITGSGHDTQLWIDGNLVDNLVSFRLVGESADARTKLILEMDMNDVEVETEADVEMVPAS